MEDEAVEVSATDATDGESIIQVTMCHVSLNDYCCRGRSIFKAMPFT